MKKVTFLLLIIQFLFVCFLFVDSIKIANKASLPTIETLNASPLFFDAVLNNFEIISLNNDLEKYWNKIGSSLISKKEKNLFFEQTVDYNDPLLKKRVIIISGDIDDTISVITAKKIMYLEKLNDKDIDLYLYTSGGVLSAAFLLIDIMKNSRCKINTYAFGKCFSAGSYILAAGTGKRFAYENATISLHFTIPNKMARKDLEKIRLERNQLFWRKHTNVPEHSNKVEDTSFWTPFEAKKLKIIDVVIKKND